MEIHLPKYMRTYPQIITFCIKMIHSHSFCLFFQRLGCHVATSKKALHLLSSICLKSQQNDSWFMSHVPCCSQKDGEHLQGSHHHEVLLLQYIHGFQGTHGDSFFVAARYQENGCALQWKIPFKWMTDG